MPFEFCIIFVRDFEPSKEVLVSNLNVVLILKIAIDITDYIPKIQKVFMLLPGATFPQNVKFSIFYYLKYLWLYKSII